MRSTSIAWWRAAMLVLAGCVTCFSADAAKADAGSVQSGALVSTQFGVSVPCPLIHTDVQAHISGHLARVDVTQRFKNESAAPIEAIYIFPLPHKAAVDRMRLVVGEHRIVGVVLKREDAQKAYQDAVASGHTAALLDQERTNIFTQSVGNIPAGSEVQIEISYVDYLEPDRGEYEFHFPMVVGPRYIPGAPTNSPASGTGRSPDTDQVADASRITPPVLKPEQRNGHDISLQVKLDAGLPIHQLRVPSHQVENSSSRAEHATITIAAADSIPNKDFVLRWSLIGEQPQASILTYRPRYEDDGYFLLTLQPGAVDQVLSHEKPRDFCFLIDVSGSMSGAPLEQVKNSMRAIFTQFAPGDRLQVVTFAGSTTKQFPAYVEADGANRERALSNINNLSGGGGTQMVQGFEEVLKDPLDDGRLRCVVLLSDGFIGNEREVLRVVAEHTSDRQRFVGLGIGSSVNRALFDPLGDIGGGLSRILLLADDPAVELSDLLSRLRKGQLTNITVDWSEVGAQQLYPNKLHDLYPGSPLTVVGRYHGEGKRTITLHGNADGNEVAISVNIDLNEIDIGHDAIAPTWARRAIEDFDRRCSAGALDFETTKAEITKLALENQLVSQFTSLVAVDEAKLKDWQGRQPQRSTVAVPLPEGVSELAVALDIPRDELQAMEPMACEESAEAGPSGAFMAIGAGGGSSGMYGQRNGGGVRRAVARASESAVDPSSRWFKRHQSPDGSWTCKDYQNNCTENGRCEPGVDALSGGAGDIFVEALALQSFSGSGYDHRMPSRYKNMMAKAVTHLLAQQGADGTFSPHPWAHAAATTALCDLYGMTNDPALKEPAGRALNVILAKQVIVDQARSGWSLDPAIPTLCDTTTTIWNLRALKAASAAGLSIINGLEGARLWFDQAFAAANPNFSAGGPADFPEAWDAQTKRARGGNLAPAGTYAAMILGRKAGDAATDALVKQVLAQELAAAKTWPAQLQRLYFASEGLSLYGGEVWPQWKKTVTDMLNIAQRKSNDCFDGSWDPAGTGSPFSDLGRLASTALVRLTLEKTSR
jgi:Ca-activated chloride channel homolog